MLNIVLEKALTYKLFMLIAFSLFSLVMYQGHISKGGIYSILFLISIALIAFQIASIFYVLFVKRVLKMKIDDSISWEIYDNKKLYKSAEIPINEIKEIKNEINYLTGNVYSSFTSTFVLKDDKEIILTDGILYDFGLKKAEEICKFLLDNNLGDPFDIKISRLVKELNINLQEEQVFTKKDGDYYYTGVISKNKREFLALRIQIEKLYDDYFDVKKNRNNEYLVENKKGSYIYLRSNVYGYFIEFYKVSRKEELKSLKQMGKRNKIGF